MGQNGAGGHVPSAVVRVGAPARLGRPLHGGVLARGLPRVPANVPGAVVGGGDNI